MMRKVIPVWFRQYDGDAYFEACDLNRESDVARQKFQEGAQERYGEVSDEEWDYVYRDAMATIALLGDAFPEQISGAAFRVAVLGHVVDREPKRYQHYEDTFLKKEPT